MTRDEYRAWLKTISLAELEQEAVNQITVYRDVVRRGGLGRASSGTYHMKYLCAAECDRRGAEGSMTWQLALARADAERDAERKSDREAHERLNKNTG